MVKDGAAIIDVGGESTRPGYEKVSDEEEIARVVPVIEAIKSRIDVPVSIDTYKPVVAKEALAAGADMVNDIWGLQVDGMADVVAKANASVCIMHNRDNVKKPYVNLMDDVISDICTSIQNGMAAGIDKDKIVVDPGIGFAKTYEENIMVLREIERLKELGYPILLGTSRKSVIGLTLDLPVTERLEGTIATTVYGIMKGCSIIRVHDVKENYRALKMTEAMLGRY
jgi:dihydropteroate synthase